jgi:hypothetical protein
MANGDGEFLFFFHQVHIIIKNSYYNKNMFLSAPLDREFSKLSSDV